MKSPRSVSKLTEQALDIPSNTIIDDSGCDLAYVLKLCSQPARGRLGPQLSRRAVIMFSNFAPRRPKTGRGPRSSAPCREVDDNAHLLTGGGRALPRSGEVAGAKRRSMGSSCSNRRHPSDFARYSSLSHLLYARMGAAERRRSAGSTRNVNLRVGELRHRVFVERGELLRSRRRPGPSVRGSEEESAVSRYGVYRCLLSLRCAPAAPTPGVLFRCTPRALGRNAPSALGAPTG